MKTNLFTHRINTFGKRLAMLITMLLVVGVSSVWGAETYSLTPDKTGSGLSNTAYITTLTEFTYNGVSWKMNQWNPSSLQIKTNQTAATNQWRFYNTSAFPGKITKVVITFSALTVSDASKLMFCGGTSEVTATSGGTAGTWNSSSKTLTWTPNSSDNFTYFAFYQNGKAASGTNKLATSNAIVVTYETAVAADPYTVTFNAGGGTCNTTTLTESSAGVGITLPTATLNDCGDWSFAGWAEASVATETTTAPATLLAAGSNYKPNANCTLYAVYQRTEENGSGGTSEVVFNFGYTDWGKGASFSGTAYDEVTQTKENIDVTYTRNSGSLYANTTSLRFYKSNTLTFDAGSNTITAITFTGSIGQSDITTNVNTCTNTSSSLSWSGSSTSVTFTRPSNASSYATLTSATLTVSGGSSSTTYYHSSPDCGSTPITPTQLDAPTNLNETNITSTSATLLWDAVANASSYVVTVVDGGVYNETFTTTSPSINITGLTAETDYLWTVQAIGDGTNYTNSEESETGEFTTIFSGYTITYETNGGDAIASVVAMALPDPLPTAKRTHYTFEGWYTDTEFTTAAVAGATLNADITLYAKWSPKVYLTTLHPNEGVLLDTSGVQQDSIIIEYVHGTSDVDIPVANYYQSITREGYKFKGWYNDKDGGSKRINVSKVNNQNFWAQWLEERTVTYYSIGQVYDTQTYGSGETLTLPTTNPTACDGYTFVGWTTAEQSETTTKPTLVSNTTVVSSDMILYAVYKRTEEGSGGGSTEVTDELSFANTNQRTSYSTSAQVWANAGITFTNNKASSTSNVGDYSNPVRLYKSSSIVIEHTSSSITQIEFDCNSSDYATKLKTSIGSVSGATVSMSSDILTVIFTSTVESFTISTLSEQIRLDALSVTYTTSNGTTTTYTTSPNCCPVNLEKPQVTYSVADGAVTLNWTMTNNAGDVADYTVACVGGETHTTTATSYTFTGLTNCTEYTFTVKANGDGTDVCSSALTTVTATPAAGSFVVTFDYGSGEGTPTQWTSGCSNGTSTTLPTPTTLPDNHTFVGWYDGTNIYEADETYTPISNITLYARYQKEKSVDIVEWSPDAVTIEINTEGSAQVQIENQTTHGSSSNIADNLFFSKYYESTNNVKLLAIFNGTGNDVDLSNFRIRLSEAGKDDCYGTTSWSLTITLSGTLEQGKEYILYEDGNNETDIAVMACVQENHADELATWSLNTRIKFSGNDAVILEQKKGSVYEIIDIIGAGTTSAANLGSTCNEGVVNAQNFMDAKGWYNADGESIEDGSKIALSTNRCLLVRKSTVKSGANAVAKNITDFVTLGGVYGEWIGKQIPNGSDKGVQASCDGFDFVGTFNYGGYYQSYDSLTRVDLGGNKNADGTYTIPVPQLDTLSCTKMRIQVYNAGGDVVLSSEYKVPIMVENAGVTTTDELFSKHGVEGCRDCDVVVLKNATLQKAANGSANDMPEVRDMEVYAGGKLVIPNGTNYTMRKLVMRSKGDEVSVAEIDGEAIIADKLYHTKRIDAQKFYFFTLPYDCNVAEMMYYNEETLGVRGVDYVIKYYDGEGRANGQNAGHWVEFTGTTLKAGVGYILAVDASLNGDFNDNPKKEFLFPMTKTLSENIDKTVAIGTWGVGDATIGDNHKGWNLIGAPFMSNYNPISATGLKVGTYEDGDWNDAGTIFTYNNSVTVPYVTMPNTDGKTYIQKLASAQDLEPFKSFFIQVGKEGEIITDVAFSSSERLSKVARRVPEVDATLWIELKLKNSVDSDVTTIIVDEDKTSEYEIGSDLEKMIGYAQKPQFYSLQTNTRLAFNALSSSIASVAIPLGFFAPEADTYTISLNTEDTQNIEGVYLTDKTTGAVTNLLFDDYKFSSARVLNDNRFSLAIVRSVTSVDNLLAEDSVVPFVHNRDLWINNAPIGSVLYVFDMLGREVISEQINKETLVYHLHMAGVYHVQIVSKDKKSVYKVVSY